MRGHSSSEKWHSRLSRIINSTVCFSLAYIVITYLYWIIMGMAGKVFGFDSFVYYYGIKYILNDRDWTRLSVTFLYSSGSFFSLVFGLMSFISFHKLKGVKTLLNVFFLWGFIIGTSIFASQSLIASLGAGEYQSPFYQNFAVIYAWWYIPVPVIYLLNIPFLFLFALFAVNYAKPFQLLAFSYSKVNTERRKKRYYVETVIVPFILGTGITTTLTFPMNIFAHVIYIMTIAAGLMVGWISLSYIEISKDDIIRYPKLQSISPLFLFLLLVLIFSVYTGWKGINLSVR
ncbi:MAG: hypothetical protein V4615_13560 [Bacteroidota bacterium]